MGGYDKQGFLEDDVTWFDMLRASDFKVRVAGVKFNNHFISGSDQYKVGFVDSGTTFVYLPHKLFAMIRMHFDWYCEADESHNCATKRVIKHDFNKVCFHYD